MKTFAFIRILTIHLSHHHALKCIVLALYFVDQFGNSYNFDLHRFSVHVAHAASFN